MTRKLVDSDSLIARSEIILSSKIRQKVEWVCLVKQRDASSKAGKNVIWLYLYLMQFSILW